MNTFGTSTAGFERPTATGLIVAAGVVVSLLIASALLQPRTAVGEDLKSLLADEQALMRTAAQRAGDPQLSVRMAELRASIAYRKFAQGDIDGAVAYLENSLALDPKRADRLSMLGDLYQLLGVPAARLLAQNAYERALALDPERWKTRIKLAAAYLASERFFSAVDEFERALQAGREAPGGEYIVPLAVAYTVTDQAPRGVAFCDKMLQAGGDARFRVAKAVLTHHQGDRPGAVRLLREVETASPGTQLALYAARLRQGYEGEEGGR